MLKRNGKTAKAMALISALLLFGAGPAAACSMCVMALTDQYLPPISLWNSIAVCWYLGTAAIASYFRVQVKFVPGLQAVGVFMLAGLVVLITGYPVLLLLAIPAIIAVALSFRGQTAPESGSFRIAIRGLALIALGAISVATWKSIHILRTRTEMEFILKWHDVTPALAIVDSWKLRQPENLDNYRRIITEGRRMPVIVSRAADRLAEVGDPAIDAPIIEAAIKRCDDEPWPADCRSWLSEPLQKLVPNKFPKRPNSQTPKRPDAKKI